MKKMNKSALLWFLEKVKKQIPVVILSGFFSMLSAASSLWLALLSKELIDTATSLLSQPFSGTIWTYVTLPEIATPACKVFALIAAQLILSVVTNRLRVEIEGRTEMSLKRSAFGALMNVEYQAFYRYHTGELLTRMTADASLSSRNFTNLLPMALSMLTRLIGGLIVITSISPYFTAGILVIGGIVAVVSRFYGVRAKKVHKKCQETEGKTRSFMQEVMGNLLSVKAFSNQPYMMEKFEHFQADNFRQRLRRNLIHTLGSAGVQLLLTSTYYLALICGAVMMIAGQLTVGTLAALLQIFEQMQAPLRNTSGLLSQYYSMIASVERLYELEQLPMESSTPLPAPREQLFGSFKTLSINNVSFSYDENAPVLHNVSFGVKRGEITALVGESGIGKSTLLKLILALLNPQTGTITIDGSESVSVDAATRIYFSYVPQGNTVVSGTLRENVTFFRPDIADDRVREALRLACLDDFVDSLHEGLNTVIGEHGYGVSEGQAQRIAIARALLNDAPVLLLDECTSALDIETEKRLLLNLRDMTDKAVLLVSHKSTTVEGSDHVFRLQDRQLTEE